MGESWSQPEDWVNESFTDYLSSVSTDYEFDKGVTLTHAVIGHVWIHTSGAYNNCFVTFCAPFRILSGA